MARKTQFDKLIEKYDGEIAVLQHARAKLVAERDEAAARRAAKAETVTAGEPCDDRR
jgi:hypothetical protein